MLVFVACLHVRSSQVSVGLARATAGSYGLTLRDSSAICFPSVTLRHDRISANVIGELGSGVWNRYSIEFNNFLSTYPAS